MQYVWILRELRTRVFNDTQISPLAEKLKEACQWEFILICPSETTQVIADSFKNGKERDPITIYWFSLSLMKDYTFFSRVSPQL